MCYVQKLSQNLTVFLAERGAALESTMSGINLLHNDLFQFTPRFILEKFMGGMFMYTLTLDF